MPQITETPASETNSNEIEPDFLAMMALMIAVENAVIRDMPITGPVTTFPSPFDTDGNFTG